MGFVQCMIKVRRALVLTQIGWLQQLMVHGMLATSSPSGGATTRGRLLWQHTTSHRERAVTSITSKSRCEPWYCMCLLNFARAAGCLPMCPNHNIHTDFIECFCAMVASLICIEFGYVSLVKTTHAHGKK